MEPQVSKVNVPVYNADASSLSSLGASSTAKGMACHLHDLATFRSNLTSEAGPAASGSGISLKDLPQHSVGSIEESTERMQAGRLHTDEDTLAGSMARKAHVRGQQKARSRLQARKPTNLEGRKALAWLKARTKAEATQQMHTPGLSYAESPASSVTSRSVEPMTPATPSFLPLVAGEVADTCK